MNTHIHRPNHECAIDAEWRCRDPHPIDNAHCRQCSAQDMWSTPQRKWAQLQLSLRHREGRWQSAYSGPRGLERCAPIDAVFAQVESRPIGMAVNGGANCDWGGMMSFRINSKCYLHRSLSAPRWSEHRHSAEKRMRQHCGGYCRIGRLRKLFLEKKKKQTSEESHIFTNRPLPAASSLRGRVCRVSWKMTTAGPSWRADHGSSCWCARVSRCGWKWPTKASEASARNSNKSMCNRSDIQR